MFIAGNVGIMQHRIIYYRGICDIDSQMIPYTDEEIRTVFEELNLATEEDRKNKRFEFFMLSDTKENENQNNDLTITDNTATVRK